MNIGIKVKVHNRFDVEVRNTITGQREEKYKGVYAENIVLDNMLGANGLVNRLANIGGNIYFGQGTGTLSTSRTSLFSQLDMKIATYVDKQVNAPPNASWCKKKITIGSLEQVGKIITEVGLSATSGLGTHALLKDAEGNPISIGPKTDTQEITIYSTLFFTFVETDSVKITNLINNHMILGGIGYQSMGIFTNNTKAHASSNKEATIATKNYQNLNILHTFPSPNQMEVPIPTNKELRYGRRRIGSTIGKTKIWSIIASDSSSSSVLRTVFPNSLYGGFHFEGQSIGIGDGIKTKFILPWNDINTTKEYKFYNDGVLLVEGTDYTLANSESETSITLVAPPTTPKPISGDYWVDYIPKDESNVLDFDFSLIYSAG